jgi:hypothetical protein
MSGANNRGRHVSVLPTAIVSGRITRRGGVRKVGVGNNGDGPVLNNQKLKNSKKRWKPVERSTNTGSNPTETDVVINSELPVNDSDEGSHHLITQSIVDSEVCDELVSMEVDNQELKEYSNSPITKKRRLLDHVPKYKFAGAELETVQQSKPDLMNEGRQLLKIVKQFSGDCTGKDADDWVDFLDSTARMFNDTTIMARLPQLLRILLTGKAARWYKRMEKSPRLMSSWNELRHVFHQQFGVPKTTAYGSRARAAFRRIKQHANESVAQYVGRMDDLIEDADCEISQQYRIDVFIDGLKHGIRTTMLLNSNGVPKLWVDVIEEAKD